MINPRFIVLIILALTIPMLIMPEGEGEVQAYQIEPTITYQSASNWSLETSLQNLTDNVFGIIPAAIEALLDIILAPIRALSTIWGNWAGRLGNWAGPIIAAFVIIVIMLMVRFYTTIDDLIDLGFDWIKSDD